MRDSPCSRGFTVIRMKWQEGGRQKQETCESLCYTEQLCSVYRSKAFSSL